MPNIQLSESLGPWPDYVGMERVIMDFANADVYRLCGRCYIMLCEEFGLILVYKPISNANDSSR
jgi:hypothetical protein